MTAYETPTYSKWIDVLPKRNGAHIGLEWQPHAEDFAHGEGFVILTSKRDRTAYAVSACHAEPHFRGFVFTKVGESKGTDAGREAYLLSCTPSGAEARCDCKGFGRWGWCRHGDALSTLIINRWL